MSDETGPDIDPRFDPAFQRGFDPAIPIREGIPAAPGHPAAPVAQPVTHSPVPPMAAPPLAARSAAPPTTPQTTSPTTPPIAAPNVDERPDSPVADKPGGRNPYLLILAVVAVILVAIGIWLFAQSGAQFNSREVRSQGDYMSLDATIHAAPFVSLLGAATAIGVVFVFAAQWRRRN